MAVKWTEEALLSLDEIADYIAQNNPVRATSFVREIKDRTQVLEKHPHLFRLGRIQGTREFVVHKNYIVIYSVDGYNDVSVWLVYHAARQFPYEQLGAAW